MSVLDDYRDAFERARTYDVMKVATGSSGAAGYWFTTWAVIGRPMPGAYPAAPTQCDYGTVGGLDFSRPAATQSLKIIQATLRTSLAGGIYIVDRLVHTQPFNMNTNAPQTVAAVNLPARAGTGRGLEIWLEVTTACAANAAGAVAVTYIDDTGAPGMVTQNFLIPAALGLRTAVRLPLATGTRGVQQLTGIQFASGWSAGAAALVIARRIATIPNKFAAGRTVLGQLAIGDTDIDADACLSFLGNSATTSTPNVNLALDCARMES